MNDVPEMVAFIGGTVIDGNGGDPIHNGVVLIDDKTISAVGKKEEVSIPSNARHVQAAGKYIIPGLMDSNVHLCGTYSVESVLAYENRLHDVILEGAQVALKNGVTTLFDTWGPLEPLKKVRDDISSGKSIGSRLFVAGNIVGFTGIFGDDFLKEAKDAVTATTLERVNAIWEQGVGAELIYMTPAQVRTRMKEYLSKGMDFVKYGVSEHMSPFIAFSPRVQEVLVEETHRAGKMIQSHQESVEGVHLALEAGVDLMQHPNSTGSVPLPEETIQIMVERHTPCAVGAFTADLIAVFARISDHFKKIGDVVGASNMDGSTFDANLRNMMEAGANLLLMTDASVMDPNMKQDSPFPEWSEVLSHKDWGITKLGDAHVIWLKAMDEKGFAPMKNLQAATRNIAEAYHVLDRLGTIEAGKLADLLILHANPLESVDNYRKIHMVIKEGKEVDRQALPVKPVFTNRTPSS